MKSYEAPSISELGSVAEFTRGDTADLETDGASYRGFADKDPKPIS